MSSLLPMCVLPGEHTRRAHLLRQHLARDELARMHGALRAHAACVRLPQAHAGFRQEGQVLQQQLLRHLRDLVRLCLVVVSVDLHARRFCSHAHQFQLNTNSSTLNERCDCEWPLHSSRTDVRTCEAGARSKAVSRPGRGARPTEQLLDQRLGRCHVLLHALADLAQLLHQHAQQLYRGAPHGGVGVAQARVAAAAWERAKQSVHPAACNTHALALRPATHARLAYQDTYTHSVFDRCGRPTSQPRMRWQPPASDVSACLQTCAARWPAGAVGAQRLANLAW